MQSSNTGEVTGLLLAWNAGDEDALRRLAPLVEAELERLARIYLSREREDHTLEPNALVNEAYLRLIDANQIAWEGRAHFFGVAARLMRQILVDHARRRRSLKHGGLATQVTLSQAGLISTATDDDFIALDEALEKLSRFDPRKCRLVELRFFGGLNVDETGLVLGISPRTVAREWSLAQAWLHRELTGGAA
jgi:RNA polymerase sigma-70 factor, ECF subfamily